MSHGPFVKIGAATAAEICANYDVKDEAKKLLRDGMNPHEFVCALIENKKHIDAIHFMAHALPVRDGIWWGCLCMQHAFGNDLTPPDRAAGTATVQWVMQPTEENRMASKAPADAAPPPSVAGALAMAAFQSGGNFAPFATAKSIALAVTLASIKTEPVKIAKMQKSYVELAIEVAEGRLI